MNQTVTITLDGDLAVEFAERLGLLEDWLMHTDELVLDDLARFGFRHCYNPSRAITELIRDLGTIGVLLRRDTDQATTSPTPGETPMNADTMHPSPTLASPRAESGECLCHDATSCPDEATVTINGRDLVEIGELLTDLDEFLRAWTGVAELMADYIRPRRNAPGMNAGLLIDTVSFNAANLRRHGVLPATEAGARR